MNLRLLCLVASLASCASAPLRPAELRASLPVEYRASLGGAGLAPTVAEPAAKTDERASERMIQIDVAVLHDPSVAASLGASTVQPFAGILGEEEATRLQAAGGEVETSPRLTLFDGQLAHFAITDERAYVSRFELTGDGHELVADPVVETLRQGASFDVRATLAADGAIELGLGWQTCDVDRELPSLERTFPGTPTPVTVQIPLALMQELRTRATLHAGEALVLVCPGASGTPRIALVRARPSTP